MVPRSTLDERVKTPDLQGSVFTMDDMRHSRKSRGDQAFAQCSPSVCVYYVWVFTAEELIQLPHECRIIPSSPIQLEQSTTWAKLLFQRVGRATAANAAVN